MMQALELLQGMCWDKVTLNSEGGKSIALAIIKLHFSEGIRYVSHK